MYMMWFNGELSLASCHANCPELSVATEAMREPHIDCVESETTRGCGEGSTADNDNQIF